MRNVKRESGTSTTSDVAEAIDSDEQCVTARRALRSRYLAVKNLISDGREDISRVDSNKFDSVISAVENLHQYVQKPREQVADAEALLDIANTLVTSLKSQSSEGLMPSDFISLLLQKFGSQNQAPNNSNTQNLVSWNDLGVAASHIFMNAHGCCTMLGPMDSEVKQRKAVVRKKRTRPTQSTCPEEVEETNEEGKSETDKNIVIMFDILRRKRIVRLDHLVLNRVSFGQTVENLFALSFLVKDGRVQIKLDDQGHHLVSPTNAPTSDEITSGKVTYSHFVLRLDHDDWKFMLHSVGVGEELMPHRDYSNMCNRPHAEPSHRNYGVMDNASVSQVNGATTPIRKLTRNRGLVIQEPSVDDSLEKNASVRQRLIS